MWAVIVAKKLIFKKKRQSLSHKHTSRHTHEKLYS